MMVSRNITLALPALAGFHRVRIPLAVYCVIRRVRPTNSKYTIAFAMDKKDDGKRIIFHRLFGGDDENRTRVQKPLDITFSVGSQSIIIPTSKRRLTGSHQGSLLMHDRYKGNSRFMFTTNLTHGESRSTHSRYGRLKSRITAYAARATVLLSFII